MRASRGLLLSISLTAFFANSSSLAHQDTIFPVSSDGELSNFPKEYGPASIQVAGATNQGKPSPAVAVRIGRHRVDLAPCIARFFVQPSTETIQATGSWYHDFSVLPPYLNIELPQRSAQFGAFDGYSLLFNMKTGQLFQVNKHELCPDRICVGGPEIPLSSLCTKSELKSMRPKPVVP